MSNFISRIKDKLHSRYEKYVEDCFEEHKLTKIITVPGFTGLKPAILYKEELEKLFAQYLYTKEYFYYNGYCGCNSLPNIKPEDNYYEYAIIDNDGVVGYITYYINVCTDSVERFGLFSFKGFNMVVGTQTRDLLIDLVKKHRRVEWRCVEGNPASKTYDHFCKRYNGYKGVFHKCLKDDEGNLLDSYTYEILDHGAPHE